MKARPSTILLSGEYDRAYEGIAVGSIRPGMLINIRDANVTDGPLTVPGRNKDVGPHNVAGGPGTMFAREMDLTGGTIDDLYEAGETVLAFTARPGDRVFALLAEGEVVAAGDLLESDGEGGLQALGTDGGVATAAAVTIGTGNAGIVFTADVPGAAGNDIQIQYLAATAATATVTVTGKLIQIKPNSTTPGTTDTANTVIALVNGNPTASALVTASALGTGASAVVSPVAATNLANGEDGGAGNATAVALEDINNAAGSDPARIKVEVL